MLKVASDLRRALSALENPASSNLIETPVQRC